MRSETLLRFLFVFYCAEAGIFLMLAPWSGVWSRASMNLPWIGGQEWLAGSWPRAAISAFGLLHLVWAAHDIDLWLAQRSRARRSRP